MIFGMRTSGTQDTRNAYGKRDVTDWLGTSHLCSRPLGQRPNTPVPHATGTELKAKHLLERAGFGATPEEIQLLARLTPS
jgi:hypothetical protein